MAKTALLTKEFWIDLGIRTVKTAAQAAVAVMTGVQTGILKDVDFSVVAQVAGYAAIVCVLWNISTAGDANPAPVPAPPQNPELPQE